MAREFYETCSAPKELFDAASNAIGVDFKRLMFEENEQLSQTEFTQPAILLSSIVAYKLFENAMPVKPVFALGHSLGEFSALTAAGAFSLADAIFTVYNRGKLMASACSNAAMMVVLGLGDETLEDLTQDLRNAGKQIWCANYNNDGQVVIAGTRADLETSVEAFKSAGAKRAMLLDMSVASHCPLMEPATAPLAKILGKKMADEFLFGVVSNVNAKKYASKAEALELLPRQLTSPVLYKQSVAAYAGGADLFIEFGGGVLKGLNKKITDKPTLSIQTPADLELALEEVGK